MQHRRSGCCIRRNINDHDGAADASIAPGCCIGCNSRRRTNLANRRTNPGKGCASLPIRRTNPSRGERTRRSATCCKEKRIRVPAGHGARSEPEASPIAERPRGGLAFSTAIGYKSSNGSRPGHVDPLCGRAGERPSPSGCVPWPTAFPASWAALGHRRMAGAGSDLPGVASPDLGDFLAVRRWSGGRSGRLGPWRPARACGRSPRNRRRARAGRVPSPASRW